jgi:A/G-specific adenine glycosylase
LIKPKLFAKKLLKWSSLNPRTYPWTNEKDPYKIWLSEIILQQTRSDQGKPYYLHFIEKYPNVFHLANASEDEILNSWQGLGYYTRARNLHKTAKQIVEEYQGIFPKSYHQIISLSGIGNYSAAAICSFAYNFPVAVVDGNVIRVLSRLFNLMEPVDKSIGRKTLTEIANEHLDKSNPGLYNQALMNFGAVHCTPKNPECNNCIFKNGCKAHLSGLVDLLPIKATKIKIKKRYFHYLFITNKKGEIALQKRHHKDIWKGLYQFPMIETKVDTSLNNSTSKKLIENEFIITSKSIISNSEKLVQKLTHQLIIGRFYTMPSVKIHDKIKQDIYFVKPENLANFAFPKIISEFLKIKQEQLCLTK